jgi:O-methyltransferase
MSLNSSLKKLIIGSRLPPFYFLESFQQLLKLGEYVRKVDIQKLPYFSNRYLLYEHLQDTVIGDSPIAYLEFGVFTGDSIRRWAELNASLESRFYGFDTFEGLPEPWRHSTYTLSSGYFSTDGAVPKIDDHRVRFIKGLFQDTLGNFLKQNALSHPLVVHLDADLYSASLFVLSTLNPLLKAGDIVLFDEFGCVNCEFRAFMDYISSFYRQFSAIGHAGEFYENVAFRVMA